MKKILIILSVVLFISCSSDDDNNKGTDTYISINPGSINIDFTESTETINIKSNTDWEITNIPDWCTFDKTKGNNDSSIKVIIKENNLSTERKATIKINNENLQIRQRSRNIKNGDVVAELMLYNGFSGLVITDQSTYPERWYGTQADHTVASSYDTYFYNNKKDHYTIEKPIKLWSRESKNYVTFTIMLVYDNNNDSYDNKSVIENFGQPKQILFPVGNEVPILDSNNLPQDGVSIEKLSEKIYNFIFKNYIVRTERGQYTVSGILRFNVKQ